MPAVWDRRRGSQAGTGRRLPAGRGCARGGERGGLGEGAVRQGRLCRSVCKTALLNHGCLMLLEFYKLYLINPSTSMLDTK